MIKLFNKEYIMNVGVVNNTSIPKLTNIAYEQINIEINDLFSNEFLSEYNSLIVISSDNKNLITSGLTDTQATIVESLNQIYQWGFALHITPLQHNFNSSIGVVNNTNPNFIVKEDNTLSKMISIYKNYYNNNITKLITFLDKERISYKVDDITNYEEVKKTKKSFYII